MTGVLQSQTEMRVTRSQRAEPTAKPERQEVLSSIKDSSELFLLPGAASIVFLLICFLPFLYQWTTFSHLPVGLSFILLREASVHLPRIGHSTKGFNWYGTERLIRKHLASRGIPTFMSVSHLLPFLFLNAT